MKKWIYILTMWMAILTGCKDTVEMSMIDMPVNLYIPVDGSSVTSRKAPLEMGDPGVEENFCLPRFAYIWFVCELSDGHKVISYVHQYLNPEHWELVSYNGRFKQTGDDVYRYKGRFLISMPEGNRIAGRVYAAMSYCPLTLSVEQPATEDELKNVTFRFDNDDVSTQMLLRQHLRDLYSSPVNYQVDGKYYGTVANVSDLTPAVDLVLYHVASKVDVIWNIPEDKQSTMKMTGLRVNNLYDRGYLLRPTENTIVGYGSYAEGYSQTLVNNNVGTWWMGRITYYTIPYTNQYGRFPLHMEMNISNTGVDTNHDITFNKKISTDNNAFVPWIRGLITVQEMTETTITRDVE